VADFNMITARLATGAAVNNADDVQQLLAAGITHIVDCRGEFDDTLLLATHPDLSYLWNGTNDDGAPKDPSWFAKSLSFALPALAMPHTKLYAHCAAGVNRGPSTLYCVMRALSFAGPVAEGLIRAARPQVGLRYKSDADSAILALGYG